MSANLADDFIIEEILDATRAAQNTAELDLVVNKYAANVKAMQRTGGDLGVRAKHIRNLDRLMRKQFWEDSKK